MINSVVALVAVAMAALGATSALDDVPAAEASHIQSSKVSDLTAMASIPYADWIAAGAYEQLRDDADYDWMDWSNDGCSGPPPTHLSYGDDFLMGCLRHDLLWRSMAVVDNADGSVWNERNRLFADKKFLADNRARCAANHPGWWEYIALQACKGAAGAFYLAVRSPWRGATTEEENSVDQDHPDHYNGIRLTIPSDCNYTTNPSNRCLPINYIEYDGKPFAGEKIAYLPVGVTLEMDIVRANQQSVDGPPFETGAVILPINPSIYGRPTGELRIQVVTPLVVGRSASLDCADADSHRIAYADEDTYPVPTTDGSLKRTTVYLKACSVTHASQVYDGLVELQVFSTCVGVRV